MNLLFFIILSYYSFKFVQVLVKMKRNVVIPANVEEIVSIRNYPQKHVDFPTYSKQKRGIFIYALMVLFVFTMSLIGSLINKFDWTFYLLLFLPLSQSYNLLNLFVVLEDGIISGNRFIAWRRIKSFNFVPIDVNHKYYGYEKEVNSGYEVIIKGTLLSVSVIITSDEMKERLSKLLNEHLIKKDNKSV
jgi:hypothetical protein